MDNDTRTQPAATPPRELFLSALNACAHAVDALLDRAVDDVAVAEALAALVIGDCDRLERQGRLDEPPATSVDRILAAVDEAAAAHRRG